MTQQTVSNALGTGPIGVKLGHAIAAALGQSFEELLEGKPPPRIFAELENWEAAASEAVAQRRAPHHAVRAVSRWPVLFEIARAEPRLVADLAALWIQWAPLKVRTDAEADDVAPGSRAPSTQDVISRITPATGTLRVPVSAEVEGGAPNKDATETDEDPENKR